MRLAPFLIASLVVTTPAFAEDDTAWGDEQHSLHSSATLSGLRLLSRTLKLHYERQLAGPVSVGGILGVQSGSTPGFLVGAEARFYFWGDFERGAYLGGDLLAITADASFSYWWFWQGSGVSVIPMLGAKVVRFGLTLDGQVGVQLVSTSGGFVPLPYLEGLIGYSF